VRKGLIFSFVLLIVSLSGCVTGDLPVEQYIFAKTAYDAAVNAEASKHAPRLLYRSEKHYKRGEVLFKERYYSEADKEFQMAQKYAERAETVARLKQFNAVGGDDY
jgi:uridine phosphorylase